MKNTMAVRLLLLLVAFFASANGQDETGCWLADVKKPYENGDYLPFKYKCFEFQCRNNRWVQTEYNKDCVSCYASDDPHFRTFDGYGYDYHNRCNHSLAQYRYSNPWTQNPDYAVFTLLGECSSTSSTPPSCIDNVVFKNGPHTIVKFDTNMINPTCFTINDGLPDCTACGGSTVCHAIGGTTYYHNVVYTKDLSNPNCFLFQGEYFAMRVCVNYGTSYHWAQTFVYVHPRLTGQIAGLCGLFNGDDSDDHTWRDNSFTGNNYGYPASQAFGETWLTNDQPTDCKPDDPVIGDCDNYMKYLKECKNWIKIRGLTKKEFQNLVADCAFDRCATNDAEGLKEHYTSLAKNIVGGERVLNKIDQAQ